MPVLVLLPVSIAVQLAAAMIAFRLTRITGRRISWLLIASALTLMTIRRSITFFRLICGDLATPLDYWAEIVALVTSGLMLGGVGWIAPLFLTRERAQMETEGEYRFLVENAGDAIVRLAPNGIFSYVSPASRWVYELDPHEIIGRSLYDFLPADQSERFRCVLKSETEVPGALRLEHEFIPKNGKSLPIHSTLRPVWSSEAGKIVEVICVSRRSSIDETENG